MIRRLVPSATGRGITTGAVLLLALMLLSTACGLFSEGTVLSGDPADSDTADEQAEAFADAPTATPAGTPIPEDAIVVGALMATVGFLSEYDTPALATAELQVEALNESGGLLGRPVVLRSFDSRTELSTIYNGARQFHSDKVDLLLLTCDVDFSAPALEVFADADTLIISPCGADDRWTTGELGDLVFSLGTPHSTEGRILAELLVDQGYTRVGMVTDLTSSDAIGTCEAFLDAFEELGGQVAVQYGYQPVDPGLLLPVAPGLAASGARAMVLCSTRAVGWAILAAIRDAGLDLPVFAGSTMDGVHVLADGRPLGEFYVLSYGSVHGDDPSPDVQEIMQAYEATQNVRPNGGRLLTGTSAMQAYALAVTRAGTTEAAAVAAQLERLDAEPLAAGPTTFSPVTHAAAGRPMRVLASDGLEMRYLQTWILDIPEIADTPGTPEAADTPQPEGALQPGGSPEPAQ